MIENCYSRSAKQIGLVVLILLSSCIGSKRQTRPPKSLLDQYINQELYAKNGSGRFLEESERIIVDSLSPNFANSGDVILIKEYCDPDNLSGCIYSVPTTRISYFSRAGKNGLVDVRRPSYEPATQFYKRIIQLTLADSLPYYKTINNKQSNADDENCWLYVIRAGNTNGKYSEHTTTFDHPLAFRRSIIDQ